MGLIVSASHGKEQSLLPQDGGHGLGQMSMSLGQNIVLAAAIIQSIQVDQVMRHFEL